MDLSVQVGVDGGISMVSPIMINTLGRDDAQRDTQVEEA